MPNCDCCSRQMDLFALTWLNKLSVTKMSIFPNLYCILQVHCSIYYVKLFNLIKDRRVQYKNNNSFPAIKQVGFSLSRVKATYHGPVLARNSVAVPSEAAFARVILCGSRTPLGHPQPLHPEAAWIWKHLLISWIVLLAFKMQTKYPLRKSFCLGLLPDCLTVQRADEPPAVCVQWHYQAL